MVHGSFEGKTIDDSEIRNLFTREYLINSDWYKDRLLNKQLNDIALWQRHLQYLLNYMEKLYNVNDEERECVREKLLMAEQRLNYYKSTAYLKSLEGYIGSDQLYKN